jgi:hypothetical protein
MVVDAKTQKLMDNLAATDELLVAEQEKAIESATELVDQASVREARIAALRERQLGKFSGDELKMAEWLWEKYGILIWPSPEFNKITWLQQMEKSFTIIGKTDIKTLAEDVTLFFEAEEELGQAKDLLKRFVAEVNVSYPKGTTIFDTPLSMLQSTLSDKTLRWAELGFGPPIEGTVTGIKLTSKIPF